MAVEPSNSIIDRPTEEEVISKLKDDGDFDVLRLKIIRKLKENDELRNRIISEVKQSAVLNCEGSEKMKPRQLSDAIHEEIGSRIMGQISDEIWKIIRSSDGMKDEIAESIRSVYHKLKHPEEKVPRDEKLHTRDSDPQAVESSREVAMPSEDELVEPPGFAQCVQVSQAPTSSCEAGMPSENNPQGPPGFDPCVLAHGDNSCKEGNVELHQQKQPLDHHGEERHATSASSPTKDDVPPGFDHFPSTDSVPRAAADDDPDVPPGFG